MLTFDSKFTRGDVMLKKVATYFGCGMALFGFLGCDSKNGGVGGMPNLVCETQVIKAKNVPLEFEYPARLKSVQSVDVYARVEGILLEQNFKEGDIVKKGQHLFKIDPTRYQARVNASKAQYNSAQANLTKATKDWARVERLYKQGALTIDQHDQSLYDYQSAQANVENTKANLDDSLIDLGYTDVVASITGRVGYRRYDVGNLVGKGSDSVLTTITQLDPIYAEFAIPSNDFQYMKNLHNSDIKVILIVNNKPYGKVGRIDFIDSVLDEQTSSVKARAIVDNDTYELMPNEFIRLQVQGFNSEDSIAIPQNALLQDSQGSYTYVVKDNQARIVRVTLGKTLKDGLVIITSGLNNGDVLITNNLSKLRDGMGVISAQDAKIAESNADSTRESKPEFRDPKDSGRENPKI